MSQLNRDDLKNEFLKDNVLTQDRFENLIDSTYNKVDDPLLVGPTGATGPTGAEGPQGPIGEFNETFETISKNLKSFPYTISYINDNIASIIYTTDTGIVTKIFNYTNGDLTSIVLSISSR